MQGWFDATAVRAGQLAPKPSASIARLTDAVSDLDAKITALDAAVKSITTQP